MRKVSDGQEETSSPALSSRRKFLKRALLAAAYAAPVVVSYPPTVFAGHCNNATCGGMDHMMGMMFWSPGCSAL